MSTTQATLFPIVATAPARRAIPRIPQVRVQLVRERSVPYTAGIDSPAALASIARNVIGEGDRETFLVIHLNTRHEAISCEVVAIGQIASVSISAREVFKAALLANASAIAIAHNHPSGDPTPSRDDEAVTRTMIAAGNLIGVPVIDHIVVGHAGHVSMREANPNLPW